MARAALRPCPTKKRKFRDEISAVLALSNIGRRPRQGRNPERAYRCRLCHSWHLTSQPYNQRKARQ